MSKIIVAGAGMVGSAMAIDLAINHRVTLIDISIKRLETVKEKCQSLSILKLDVTDKQMLQVALLPYDLAICPVPGYLGFTTLKTIIECGRNVVDISFFSENSADLDHLAKEIGVAAIVDCGVAPFSPIDVIEEYTRLARYVENGKLIVREPLTDCEFVEFDRVGTLESFNSVGLRSIIFTMPHIPDMKEKNLWFPATLNNLALVVN